MDAGWSFSIQLKRWLSNAINVTYVTAYNYWNTVLKYPDAAIRWDCCLPTCFPSSGQIFRALRALCGMSYSLNHRTIHSNRSSHHHPRSSREVPETHLSWCGGPSIILGTSGLGLFCTNFVLKTYKVKTPYKVPHNIRLFESALESSKSHRTIYDS